MSKKLIFIVLIVAIFVAGGAGAYFFLNKQDSSPLEDFKIPVVNPKVEQTAIPAQYQDASGFSFQYPQTVKIADKTPDDLTYYSLLEITSDENPGKLTITIKDTKFSDSDAWFKKELSNTKVASSSSVTFINLPAKQYVLDQDEGQVLLTATIDEKNVLYLIEGPKDNGFWEDLQKNIIASFIFSQPGDATSASSSQNSGAIYESEEKIQ